MDCCSKKPPKKKVQTERQDGSKDGRISFGHALDNQSSFQDVYQVGQCVGKGTLGEVRTCEHRISQQKRAVRITKKDQLDPDTFDQYLTHRLLSSVMDHPNLLKSQESFQDKKRFFLVTDLMQGGELFHMIENHANSGTLFTEEESATIIDQVLKALRYLHQNKLMLMDLKPENILFQSKTDVLIKLCDFHSVRTTLGKGTVPILGEPLPSAANSEPMEVLGTSYYIAPEVLDRNYDESCDMWSLGAIMYLMLTGVPPFNGENDQEILAKVRQGKFSVETLVDAGASDEAIDLLKLMLEKDRHKRITAELAQSHPWVVKNIRKETAGDKQTNNALTNLRSFKLSKKLQEAAI
jgi:calcium-dependent protein kinase